LLSKCPNTNPRSSSKSLQNQYHRLILTSKKHCFSNFVSSVSDNPKCLWQTVNYLGPAPHPLSPLLLRHYKSPTAPSCKRHTTCGISSLSFVPSISSCSLSPGSPHLKCITSSQPLRVSSLSPSITPLAFHSTPGLKVKTHLFHKSSLSLFLVPFELPPRIVDS